MSAIASADWPQQNSRVCLRPDYNTYIPIAARTGFFSHPGKPEKGFSEPIRWGWFHHLFSLLTEYVSSKVLD